MITYNDTLVKSKWPLLLIDKIKALYLYWWCANWTLHNIQICTWSPLSTLSSTQQNRLGVDFNKHYMIKYAPNRHYVAYVADDKCLFNELVQWGVDREITMCYYIQIIYCTCNKFVWRTKTFDWSISLNSNGHTQVEGIIDK